MRAAFSVFLGCLAALVVAPLAWAAGCVEAERAGASEPASYAFSLTNSPKWSIGACAITGADGTNPVDVHAGSSAASGNPSAPSVTTSGAQRLLLAFYANKKPTTYSDYTAPAVERFDVPNTSGGLPSNAMASYTQAAAGATGTKAATASETAEWVAQQVAIAPAAGATVTKYLWDVNQPLPELALERDGQGNLLRRYLHGNDLHSMHTPAGGFYYHADGLGSITNLTDAAGAKQWTHVWEPFGTLRMQTQDSPTAPANPMRFTGEHEDASGLYHLRARQYDPVTGRFLATDPLEQSIGDPAVSLYAYVSNRPTVLVDPLGLDGFNPVDGFKSLVADGVDVFGDAGHATFNAARDGFQASVAVAGWTGHWLYANRACLGAVAMGDPNRAGRGCMKAFTLVGHLTLDAVGMIPILGEPADLLNCAWYGTEGDELSAGLSCGAAIPIVGWLATAGKAAKAGDEAVDVGPRLIYEHNPKHGPVARQGPRGEISRAPRGDCQAMLECSTLVKPTLRTGVEPETGLEVIFRRHRVFENTEWWHGYVPRG